MLSGGELPALVIADAVVRRLDGVLHNEDSADNDSFTADRGGGLDCAWYTKPPEYRGLAVPEVLLSGHHAQDRGMARASRPRRGRNAGGRTWPDRPTMRMKRCRPDGFRGGWTPGAAGGARAPAATA